MLKKATIFLPALLIATLNGCTTNPYYETKDTDLVEVSYDAACTLQHNLKRTIPEGSLVIVSTLLNVDDLKKTSSFGRIISDQLASAFHNSGYRIIGMELPIDLFVMQEGGVLHLPDEAKKILKKYGAAAIVGGVYAPGKRSAYVSLRMIDSDSTNIISSTDISVPIGPDVKVLLESKEVGSAGSRSESTATSVAEPAKSETQELKDPK